MKGKRHYARYAGHEEQNRLLWGKRRVEPYNAHSADHSLAADDFQKRTSVVHGCICSLLKTWEAKQYSTMRDRTLIDSWQEEDGCVANSASLFALL